MGFIGIEYFRVRPKSAKKLQKNEFWEGSSVWKSYMNRVKRFKEIHYDFKNQEKEYF